MEREELVKAALHLSKFLRKLKLKEKDSILISDHKQNVRVTMFRTDDMRQLLEDTHYVQLNEALGPVAPGPVKDFESLLRVVELLIKQKLILKLDRAPLKIKGQLKRWPKEMMLGSVG